MKIDITTQFIFFVYFKLQIQFVFQMFLNVLKMTLNGLNDLELELLPWHLQIQCMSYVSVHFYMRIRFVFWKMTFKIFLNDLQSSKWPWIKILTISSFFLISWYSICMYHTYRLTHCMKLVYFFKKLAAILKMVP